MKFRKDILFNVITLFFIISSPIVFILAAIPFIIIGLYLILWNSYRTEKVESLNETGKRENYTNTRSRDITPIFKKLIPPDASSCLDIGAGRYMSSHFMKCFFKKYVCLDIYNADIEQDLNIKKEINLPDNSIDIVIASNILEHLVDPMPIALEANRISKKYLIIGLPNEYPLDERLLILFGIYHDKIYPWGHKHRLSIKSNNELISSLWGKYEKRIYKFQFIGARFIPNTIKQMLMEIFPSLFVGEVFYLVRKKDIPPT
ncbi:methyltransferase domain-containing protein [Candidatus Pacearchaeota archaeon]|nr:methyltransferase domain-containing protein [Candidatus Pacearchaeota archaeon]